MLLQEVANQFTNTTRAVNSSTELRFLPDHARLRLTTVLDAGDGWRKILHLITHPDDSGRMLFNADHARVLENYTRGSRSDEILKTWSTTGRNRPKISDLVDLLKQAELHRAASIVEVEVLQQAPGDNEDVDDDLLDEPDLGPPPPVPSENCDDDVPDEIINEAPRFRYDYLARATGNFCDVPVSEGGSKVGEGAFGVVYKGKLPNGSVVAVKRMKESLPEQFLAEVRLLQRHSHPNLLPLIGICYDTANSCLVYEFMELGSLQSCLARENCPMYWKRRISILTEVAAAIHFLHTRTPCLIHRDVKSANILLDRNWTAKLGDFGLIRPLSGNNTTRTEIVVGTTVYMAPEAFNGTISTKMDTFSFGVVIMEVLTGLPPYTLARGDIQTYLKEEYPGNITPVLDTSAGVWDSELAQKVYEIGENCVVLDRRQRPTMQPVYTELLKLNHALNTPES
ncbi:interleukin-1 receptor-associated kinase 4-like [Amblyomma americanum]